MRDAYVIGAYTTVFKKHPGMSFADLAEVHRAYDSRQTRGPLGAGETVNVPLDKFTEGTLGAGLRIALQRHMQPIGRSAAFTPLQRPLQAARPDLFGR